MGKLIHPESKERNVTLGPKGDPGPWFVGKKIPCLICGIPLILRVSKKDKPYCHCDDCGIQVFFRRKTGIERLRSFVKSFSPFFGKVSPSRLVIPLYNRVQQLKIERQKLEGEQGYIFRDSDLDQAISVINQEIEEIRNKMNKLKK